jgi:hypothetical protein
MKLEARSRDAKFGRGWPPSFQFVGSSRFSSSCQFTTTMIGSPLPVREPAP